MSAEPAPNPDYLYLDATAPVAGRRAHWAYIHKGAPDGPVVARLLLDDHLSTSERRTSDEQYAENVAWAKRFVAAYNDLVRFNEPDR